MLGNTPTRPRSRSHRLKKTKEGVRGQDQRDQSNQVNEENKISGVNFWTLHTEDDEQLDSRGTNSAIKMGVITGANRFCLRDGAKRCTGGKLNINIEANKF